MQTTIPTLGTISWGRRLMPAAIALGLLLVLGFAQTATPQNTANVTTACSTTSLCLDNNYFVTGDYVVGGDVFDGKIVNGLATGTITIPDPLQSTSTSVPAGAEIVAAFLYWETVESTNAGAITGQVGSFNGSTITGVVLGNPKAPTSWSAGGCSGNAQGSKTMRAYRADVRPLLPVDANGNIQANGAFKVGLQDSGSNGNGVPISLGGSLVIIYRVLSPAVPLKSIVLYDGAAAPGNTSSTITQPIVGFYQVGLPTPPAPPSVSPITEMTQIVGNGQSKKGESVLLNGTPLPNLYPTVSTIAAFPGIYNGSWDNATWTKDNSNINTLVHAGDFTETTSVAPTPTNGNCVNWGAIIFSTTVQDSDNDGLVDYWEQPPPNPVNLNPSGTSPGYIDAKTGQFVALPGANPNVKDIFVEVDYLELCATTNPDGTCKTVAHSHLPKQQALDNVGNAFKNAPVDFNPITKQFQGVKVHFDLGPGIYQGDPFVVTYPVPLPPGTVIGGNAIPESATVCDDATSPTLCQFPGTSAVGWKGGFLFVKDNQTLTLPGTNTTLPLGNFQPGREVSYHYMLFGHDLGASRSIWSTFGANLQNASLTQLVSIVVSTVNSVTTTTVTIQTPSGLVKPGDCKPTNTAPACTDANGDRVTVGGAAGQPALNGTYQFANLSPDGTTFTITTANVPDGTYVYNSSDPKCVGQTPPCASEPRLAVEYGGPTSASGQSDFPGGADSSVMFGGWPADDPLNADGTKNCQGDPSQPLGSFPAYCNDQLGSVQEQGGTIMHELGHTLTLAHGGTYYALNSSVPTYEFNCKPNFLSVMSYLFQARGFPDPVLLPDGTHPIDYSGQTVQPMPLQPLDETQLNELTGIGLGVDSQGNSAPARHLTRWYGPLNALDTQLGRFARLHCDGTPTGLKETPAVLVDGSTFSTPIDWMNDLDAPDAVVNPRDVNFNGSTSDAPFRGFNDWSNVDLLQVSSREGALGLSSGGGLPPQLGGGGGGLPPQLGGGGGGLPPQLGGGGGGLPPQLGGGGGGLPPQLGGGGGTPEQDQDMACSTADPPTGLSATNSNKTVVLNWTAPGGPCQVRRYDISRAVGSFTTLACALTTPATCTFTKIGTNVPPPTQCPTLTLPATTPCTTFTDPNVKNNVTYTYFVTGTNKQEATSGPSAPAVIPVKF